MKALIPQGLIERPNYFGLLNNSMTLIICESLRHTGEMACVTSAWSPRGQTLKAILFKDSPNFSLAIQSVHGEVKMLRKYHAESNKNAKPRCFSIELGENSETLYLESRSPTARNKIRKLYLLPFCQ